MKVFDEAVLRLTAVYTAILLTVSVGFSVACYFAADHELNRPFRQRGGVNITHEIAPNGDETFLVWARERDNEIRTGFLMQLVFINFGIVVGGAVLSYFLARRTLRPIREMTERQANFISDASHELRTPLAAIQMENEVLLKDEKAKSGDYKKQVESNLEELYKVTGLTERLLEITQTDSLNLTEVNAAKTVEIAVRKMTKMAGRKDVKLANKVGQLKLRANAAALEQILLILLDNAIKYSPHGKCVTVGQRDQKLYVADEGDGIGPEDLPHIFDRFYRAEKSRTTDGYGLGLSLAQHLAGKMNLKITAGNGKVGGAIFWIA
ncbi:MAG: HAMP domain-containing histidine kinase [Candidatus Nomurabacteria bacterium]|jgi:signal transduction histidine kinase|nr:HAMP domain-containing histidine kinase [Candidatus Nomurabacteria bacterium]